MLKLTDTQALQMLARAIHKPCMMISISLDNDIDSTFIETIKAAPYLDPVADLQLLCDSHGVVIFDTEVKMNDAFLATAGLKGAKTNLYRGPSHVFAVTCSADGVLLNENV